MTAPRSPHLLIVDDNEMNRDMLSRRLTRQGCTVECVKGGQEALETLEARKTEILAEQFDVVLLDVMMPEIDGFEVLNRIQADSELCHIPVLMLSALTDGDAVLRCIEAGAEDYLHKPFDMVMLRARIGACVRKKELHGQLQAALRDLKEAKKEDQNLLRDMLPAGIAEEIKTHGKAVPKTVGSATVMFTDFAGFTQVAEQLTPEALLDSLDTCFSYFDQVVAEHNLQKIKTIGDSYMCCGGLPVANNTHVIDTILAALKMRAFIAEEKRERAEDGLPFWGVRIGIHTGPLVAGVIGKSKPVYDVWGDTVNIASRMESSGEVGRINVTRTAFDLAAEFFLGEHRGRIPAKHKGEIEMYFVDGIRPELTRSGDPMTPSREFWNSYEKVADASE